MTGTAAIRSGVTDLVVVYDLAAWRRGSAGDGEVCHVVGGGPVPVAVARDLCADTFVKAVIRNGRRIDTWRTSEGTSPPSCAPPWSWEAGAA